MIVREGKGGKDRVVTLPDGIRHALKEQLLYARALWEADRQADLPGVFLPHALEMKYPRAGQMWAWQWVFPSPTVSLDPDPHYHVPPVVSPSTYLTYRGD